MQKKEGNDVIAKVIIGLQLHLVLNRFHIVKTHIY